ncbi:MAG: alpha-hydroxy-acid oxidizing protein [Candidatus Eremiobacteraeota bacterium]|nr:alpha-hydroxy-acid oxidizing protein [Candidatus Eremiobacteraeota bacterium]MBC5828411.1 alpha-hydroxy-acid oxidizing protein [Candidatus Eremiobacteraeota bacterium]
MNPLTSSSIVNIEDLRRMASRRLPKVVFDYIDGGAEGEVTLRENCLAFEDVGFRPRHAVSMEKCDLRTKVLQHELAFPAMLAPVGYSRLMHPDGEIAAARAAGEAGTGYVLSTISGHRLERVRAASRGPVWYQLYLMGGRAAAEAAIERARRAGFSALVITIDTPVAGMRESDPRNGMKELLGRSPFAKLRFLPPILARPAWLTGFLRDGGVPKLENVVIPQRGPMPLIDIGAALAGAVVTWKDLRWLRQVWDGPIVVKGVLTREDARRAVDEGAAAVVVSNHGGRQLDGVPASLRVLPEIAAAVNGQAEVIMDGGIRRGSDIVKAVCLGARAVLVGRAYAYGLAAGGRPGVARALNILRDGVERTLRLLGCPSVAELNSSFVHAPEDWRPRRRT